MQTVNLLFMFLTQNVQIPQSTP